MCGIFGYVKTKKTADISDRALLENLIVLSESRGKESSGIAYRTDKSIGILKMASRGSTLIETPAYKKIVADELSVPCAVIGHARLVTNGAMEDNSNNQPVIRDGIVGIHNGIIVNDSKIWDAHSDLTKNSGVDTEVLLALIRNFEKQGVSLSSATVKAFGEIEGTASIALLFNDFPYLLLATNNGSLYFAEYNDFFVFASEEFILESFLKQTGGLDNQSSIQRIAPNNACLIHIKSLAKTAFPLTTSANTPPTQIEKTIPPVTIRDLSGYVTSNAVAPPSLVSKIVLPESFSSLDASRIQLLKRCSKCILPTTMPFVNFDQSGVCNYCRNHKKVGLRSKVDLKSNILKSKNQSSRFDCIVPLSGGRDSSYALHYITKVLGLRPIAYSYDWGMLTDLGRRNQARMCGALGVEHILVSADIRKKRNNIRKNVEAWLKKPNLGIIPLFMAGDKQYFYFANQLSKHVGGAPIVYAENPYEKTDFKSGFCGVPPVFDIEHVYNLGLANKVRLASYYLKEYIKNPSLVNSSIFDTLGAYVASYFIPHNYQYLYLYKKWNEKEIISTLVDEYNWELATDTNTSWRIGDGTAAFYNFIYYSVAGFTEADTFYSNQIREGEIDRDTALQRVKEDNAPRYESIKWYCDIIGIDFKNTLSAILNIPKLYG